MDGSLNESPTPNFLFFGVILPEISTEQTIFKVPLTEEEKNVFAANQRIAEQLLYGPVVRSLKISAETFVLFNFEVSPPSDESQVRTISIDEMMSNPA